MNTRGVVTKETLIWILVVLFIAALLFGGLGAPNLHWGAWGWSPAGLIVALFILVLLLG